MEYFYVGIPLFLFVLSFITRGFIKTGFWETLNVGRTLCLESLSMGAIAYLHMRIEDINSSELMSHLNKGGVTQFNDQIREILNSIKMESDLVIIICGIILCFYLILSLSELKMNEIDEKTKLKRKFKDPEKTFSFKFRAHVIFSLLFGLLSLSIIIFIYFYDGSLLGQSLLSFFFTKALKVYLIVLLLIIIAGFIKWLRGNFEGRGYRESPVIE